MFKEVKTISYYLYCLDTKRAALWNYLLSLDNKGETDNPDYHRAIAAWSAYDTAVALLEELIKNNPSLIDMEKEES